MINIDDHLANIRYQLNGCIEQANKVHEQMRDLDLETIQLNLQDLHAQMKVAQAELDDAIRNIEAHLQLPDQEEQDDNTSR